MTIQHPTKKFSPCPWCGSPGVLYFQDIEYVEFTKSSYFIGCSNLQCEVRPRTKKILFTRGCGQEGKDWALAEVTRIWEKKEEKKC